MYIFAKSFLHKFEYEDLFKHLLDVYIEAIYPPKQLPLSLEN